MEAVIEGWLTAEQVCRRLKLSYWKFYRNVMPHLESVQPSGRYGQRFFKEVDVTEYESSSKVENE